MTPADQSAVEATLAGRRVLVLGCGRSGLAAARFATMLGASVTVTDDRTSDELGERAPQVADLGARLRAGGMGPELVDDAQIVVLSPGVPPERPIVRRARELGLPVWGEIELGARHCRGRVIAVTGSNGKSTTTSAIGAILGQAGYDVGTGGNLDTPFCDLLDGDHARRIYSLELSSFQLETLESLRPEVALVLNLSPDHLDRYPSFEAYAAAKARLFALQSTDAAALVNVDDPNRGLVEPALRARRFEFSTERPVTRGALLDRGWIVLRTDHGDERIMERDAFALPGSHNASNALAAALACRLAGCSPESIAAGLRGFRALDHRLQRVETIGGVTFFNDSKATNPDAAARALSAFEPGRVHLILGGREKGADWDELIDLTRRRARRVLLVGEAAPWIARRLGEAIEVERCETVRRAVSAAYAAARSGDVVLLSPGCASYDQYSSFEERGRDFVDAVRGLSRRDGGRDA